MLRLSSVSKYYRTEETVVQALRRISLSFNIGEFVVITGESGSGKSTLLNVLSGLDTYEEGELFINEEETSYYSKEDWEHYRSQYIGFIFQNYNIIDSYTVYQNVVAALTIQGYQPEKRKSRALELIDRVGLTSQTHQKSSTLSGGQKQRVSIARALAKDAPMIVADEPTGNLDKDAGENIIKLLKEISQDKLVIMVTHNYDEVKAYATRRVRLFDGEVAEDKVINQVEPKPASPKPLHEGMRLKEKIAMSFRNLLAMPKRLILTLAISIFIVAVFSLSYGSYVQSTSALDIGYYHPFFDNNDTSRLIVLKRDQSAFTQAELDEFQAMNLVRQVITFDPVLEVRFNSDINWSSYSILPAARLSSSNLREGRLPTSRYEIIVPRDSEYGLGDEVTFTPSDSWGDWERFDNSLVYKETYTVVGIHSARYSYNVFLHDSAFEDPLMHFEVVKKNTLVSFDTATLSSELSNLNIYLDATLDTNEIIISGSLMQTLRSPAYFNNPNLNIVDLASVPIDIAFKHPFVNEAPIETVTIVEAHSESMAYFDYIIISPDLFEQLFIIESTQITLVVEDNFDANKLMSQLDSTIYHSVYPAEYESMSLFDFGIFERLFNFIAIFFQLTVMYFLTYLALRNIMRARKKDYVIFRSIGATQKDLNHVTIFELIIIFIAAFILVYTLLAVNASIETRLPNYLRYYTFGNYIFVIGLLIAMATLLGIRFNHKIFKDSVITALRVE